MELRHVISFYHTAKLQSVSKAARLLELGRPTITLHVRHLEAEFGITIFDRKRPMTLTPDGATFLKLVTPIVRSVEALKTQVAYPERRGSFVIGAYPDLVMPRYYRFSAPRAARLLIGVCIRQLEV